jgi:hypothetical protein
MNHKYIESIAKEIHPELYDGSMTQDQALTDAQDAAITKAKAIVTLILVPTDDMYTAGQLSWVNRSLVDSASQPLRDVYTAMLNHILL